MTLTPLALTQPSVCLSPTFLNNFAYYMSCEDEELAATRRQEIINSLNGIPIPENEAMKRGSDFEQSLCDFIDGKPFELMADVEIYEELAGYVRGAIRQQHVIAPIDNELSVHGYIDFWNGKTVYDLKTTGKYNLDNAPLNYEGSAQHKAYLAATHITGSTHFKYLIVDFSGEKRYGKSLFIESYEYTPRYEDDLRGMYSDLMKYLEIDDEMRQAFEKKHNLAAA